MKIGLILTALFFMALIPHETKAIEVKSSIKTIWLPEIDLSSVPYDIMEVLEEVIKEGDSLVKHHPPRYIIYTYYKESKDEGQKMHLYITLKHHEILANNEYVGFSILNGAEIIFSIETDIKLISKKPMRKRSYKVETGLPILDGFSEWHYIINENEIKRISHVGHW